MKKVIPLILALILTLLTACSGTPAEELSDILTKEAAVESRIASGAARITFPSKLTQNDILKNFEVRDQPDDVVLELLFNAEIDEANQKAKVTLSNYDESHLADVFINSEKYYLEMENLFGLYAIKTGGTLPFTKEDMGQQRFLNIPKSPWQSHLPTLYTALTAAISEDENLVQESDEYYSLTLTTSAFAASLTSPFKEWMADGYELVYVMEKKDHAQAITLTIPEYIKIELQWKMDSKEVNVEVPEGILLDNVMKSKPEQDPRPEPEAESEPGKKLEEEAKEPDVLEDPNGKSEESEESPDENAELTAENTETGIKTILISALKEASENRKLLTAGIFNENTNLDALMDSTAKWLSPLQECYRQSDGNYTYLGLTSLPHENCLPSERDAININFYRMGVERKLEVFIEYDEPSAIKQQLDTFIDVCGKCGYTVDKECLVQIIDIMHRDAKILVKNTEKDYYMETVKVGNVNLSAYIAFAGDRYIYMITLDESRS